MALTARVSGSLSATQVGAATTIDLGTVTPAAATVKCASDLNLADGVGAGMADVLYQDTGTVAASGTADIDLAGALVGALGGTSVFAKVKGIYIAAAALNTNDVVVGAAAANPWSALLNATGTITLRPGAWILCGTGPSDSTGWVTAGGSKVLRITNSAGGTSVSYSIAVIGTSV